MKIPPRPRFSAPSNASDRAASTERLEHIMTLLEVLIQGIEALRQDIGSKRSRLS